MDRLNSLKEPSWNPLDCSAASLPLPLALCAKLMVLYLLITGEFLLFPEPFLPFIPLLDQIGHPVVLKNILQSVFLIASFFLLFNRYARSAAFATGAAFFLAILSSKPYFSNPRFFFACFLMLIGLYKGPISFWFLRLQLVLVYFGAALNKLLSADWQSGQYIEFWAKDIVQFEWYYNLSTYMAPLMLSKIISWMIILTEFFLAAAFAAPYLTALALGLGLFFHIAMLIFMKMGIAHVFLYAMTSAYLTLLKWPKNQIVLHYPKKFDWLAATVKKTDFSSRFLTRESETFFVKTDEKSYTGIWAILSLARYNPLTYFLLAGVFFVIFRGLN